MTGDFEFPDEDEDAVVSPQPVAATPRQWQVNMRVWFPVFSSSAWQDRLVRYSARERREGRTWLVAMPHRCWRCEAAQDVEDMTNERRIRAFEHPVGIILGGAMVSLAVLAASLFWLSWTGIFLAVGCALAAGMLLWLRSSAEEVRLSLAACRAHAATTEFPQVCIFDNDLYLFSPTPELAAEARRELKASRRGGNLAEVPTSDDRPRRSPSDASPEMGACTSGRDEYVAPVIHPRREELPPIKLEGDD